jgi:hypothetical protein
MFFSLGCDGCFKVGLPTILIKNFMWIKLSYSYAYVERFLYSAQEAWIIPNLDLDYSWCEHFGPVVFVFKIIMMSNGAM